jgi:large subunit ribosomal protein L14e
MAVSGPRGWLRKATGTCQARVDPLISEWGNPTDSSVTAGVIVEIIDHNRAVIDGPTTGVPRQSFPYRHLTLTPLRLTKLPLAAGSGTVKKQVEAEAIVEKWEKSTFAKKRAAMEARRQLNDFGRFKAMVAKKQRTDRVRKSLRAAKKA